MSDTCQTHLVVFKANEAETGDPTWKATAGDPDSASADPTAAAAPGEDATAAATRDLPQLGEGRERGGAERVRRKEVVDRRRKSALFLNCLSFIC